MNRQTAIKNRHLGSTYFVGVTICLIILFSVLRPEGTPTDRFHNTILFWFFQISITMIVLVTLQMALQSFHRFDQLNSWTKVFVTGVLGAIFMSPIGLTIDFLFDDTDGLEEIGFLASTAAEFFALGPPTILTWIGINSPFILQLNFEGESESPLSEPEKHVDDTQPSSPETVFFRKLKNSLGTKIQSLSSELHYVRVITDLGEDLILYNLADAVQDVQSVIEGLQIHRSHWVALSEIKSTNFNSRGGEVVLSSGVRLPISRRRVSDVKHILEQR